MLFYISKGDLFSNINSWEGDVATTKKWRRLGLNINQIPSVSKQKVSIFPSFKEYGSKNGYHYVKL